MNMRRWNLVLYGLFGVLGVGLGALAFLGLVTLGAQGEEAHLVRELGAGAVFVGLMNLWCMRNYEARLPVHLALMLFAALFAVIHWQDWLAGARPWTSPALNTVPFVLLASMLRSDAGASASDRVPRS
jgi:hypothetical protein